MSLPEDMTSLVYSFNTAGSVDVVFQRWLGNAQVIGGVAIDNGYESLTLSSAWVFVPRVPKKEIDRIPTGARLQDACLVWSIATDALGTTYDVLQSIDQPGRTRPDRIVDNDTGLTYEVVSEWAYGRQAKIAGAIGLIIRE